ncbi:MULTISPECIES: pro-sigmaK processing inhibitor BofA family protein [Sporosarcina]|uniref:Inhibitor of the pro-sigma K processing machinery n=1 Tax=Sporosarcina newyorkensis TaxID=759851 RepID=A0A1T4Z1B5_9BACL|nr:pro-sigmaK processing inhibitor BofA family protein [Sporosarcina newyorkensis]MBY0220790.1 pro-sigmaK processing inhibitor BofA family protein [Sporosarcina aquimarina]SKB07608.1 inhibitor of the pro-sigma K processing machinery [Sporosarcina newyorkensis]
MRVLVIVALGIVSLILLSMSKTTLEKNMERLSVFWFRLAFAFFVLFLMNIAGGFIGIYVPVNIASGIILAVLGVPGFAALCGFAILF